jgi:hypothetical protein
MKWARRLLLHSDTVQKPPDLTMGSFTILGAVSDGPGNPRIAAMAFWVHLCPSFYPMKPFADFSKRVADCPIRCYVVGEMIL